MGEITHKQEKLITALMIEPTISAAIKAASVSNAHAYRWFKEPAFVEAWRAARRDALQAAIGSLQAATGEAVAALRAVLLNPDTPPALRVNTARAILDHAFRATEIDDLDRRIAALEAVEGEGGRP